MPFRYRLQKALDFRIRKKDQQLQVVILAQQEVYKIEGMIELNNREIDSTRINMKKADFYMLDAYDKFLKSLYEKAEQLEEEKKKAEEVVAEEKRKLVEAEKDVKVLEKHKERMHEIYKEEEKAQEGRRAGEEEQSSDHRGGRGGRPAVQPGDRRQGVYRFGRPVRLRQVHHPAYDRRSGGHHLRRAVDRRQADERCGAQGPRHRHGVPELRPVPPHDRV